MVLGEKGKLHGLPLVFSRALFQLLLMLTLILFSDPPIGPTMETMTVRMFSSAIGNGIDAIVPGLAIATLIVLLLQWLELRATRKDVARWLRPLRYSVPVFPLAVVAICCVIFFNGMSIEGVWVSPHDFFFNAANIPFIYAQF